MADDQVNGRLRQLVDFAKALLEQALLMRGPQTAEQFGASPEFRALDYAKRVLVAGAH